MRVEAPGLVRMKGLDSCRAVAASVIRGSKCPPDTYSLPLLLQVLFIEKLKETNRKG